MYENKFMYDNNFALRISKLRTQKGVSARDMSLSIGQNAGYINNIETGKALPSMTSFFYICEYLGITPQETPFACQLRWVAKWAVAFVRQLLQASSVI